MKTTFECGKFQGVARARRKLDTFGYSIATVVTHACQSLTPPCFCGLTHRGQVCGFSPCLLCLLGRHRGKNYKALAAKSSRYLFKKIYMKNQIEGSSTGHLNPKIPTGFWTFLGKTDPSLAGMITLLIH